MSKPPTAGMGRMFRHAVHAFDMILSKESDAMSNDWLHAIPRRFFLYASFCQRQVSPSALAERLHTAHIMPEE